MQLALTIIQPNHIVASMEAVKRVIQLVQVATVIIALDRQSVLLGLALRTLRLVPVPPRYQQNALMDTVWQRLALQNQFVLMSRVQMVYVELHKRIVLLRSYAPLVLFLVLTP